MTVTGVDFNRVGKPDVALQPQFGFGHPCSMEAPCSAALPRRKEHK